MTRAIRPAAAALSLLLGACSLIPVEPPAEALIARSEQARSAQQQWLAKGRATTDSDRAHLRWRQEGEQFTITLRGPFGLGGVKISGTPAQVSITDGKDEFISHAPTRDIHRQTGFWVPVEALPYWMKAVPAPGLAADIQRDDAGRITGLSQGGWTIAFADYRLVDGMEYPHLITLQQTPQVLELELREWRLN